MREKEKFFQVFFQTRIPGNLIGLVSNLLDKEIKRNPHSNQTMFGWREKFIDISLTARKDFTEVWLIGYIIVSLEEGTMIEDGYFTYWSPPVKIIPSTEYSGHTLSIEVGNAAYLILRYCKITHVGEFEAVLENL